MPVISPRRSTSSTSGSLYIPQTTSGTYSSSLANKSTTGSSALSSSSSSSTSGYSSTYRSNGYTKSPSTTYSSSSFYPGSYLSRGTYPSVSRSSYSSTPLALTGGSSALTSSYRASSYLTSGNNDTTTSSSRFGRDLDHKRGTDNTDCNQNNNNNYSHTKSQRSNSTSRNPRASSSSYPSSSLARLVATSALEIYEKYSPANYIPKCELSRSSSLSEGAASAAATTNAATTSSSTSLTNNDSKITSSNSSSRISNNNNNNYSRRYSRHTNGTINENSEAPAPACSSITDTYLSVPQHSTSNGGSSRAANKLLLHVSYDLPDDSNSLRDLKISCISPTTTTTTSATSTSSSSSQDTRDTAQLATKQKRSVEAKITTTSSNNTTTTTTTSAAATTTTTTTSNNTTSHNPNQPTTTTISAKAGNQQFFLISAFKDQNFLKKECELARSQVSRSRQRFENDNGIEDDNNNNISSNNNNNVDDSQYVNNNENGGSPLAGNASSHDNYKLQGATAAKYQPSIKPLIHRVPISSNNRFLSSRYPANNNMHCLHSNSELLDDIKYIDSDDTERQHQQQQQQHQQRQHKPKLRPKSSIISSSNQSLLFEKVNPYKYQNGTLLSSSPPVSSSAPTSTTSTATSSPSSTLPLMGGRRCDTSSIKASIEKFNTLAEAKRLPTRCSTTNLQLSNDHDRRVPLRERSASPATSSSAATTRGSSITSNLAASNSTSSGSIASNNLILRNRSTESSPSHSPKHLRKTSITTFTGGLLNGSTSNLVRSNATYDKLTLTTVSMLSCPTPTLSTVTSRTISIDKKLPSASSSSSSPSNKNFDIDESVRNTSSLRSTLPPISPKPTRDWDRDTSTSSILSSRNLSDDYSSSSSRKVTPEQEGLCGLRNIGNTCFMNSVIQCLSHTSELTKFLKTQNGVRSSSSKDQQILSEFAKLIKEMWTSNVNSVTPSELKRAFSSKHRMYSDYNQQDAQEFLRFFLDSLHSALNSGVKGDLLKIDESLSDNRKADITWEWYAKAENSVIRDLFVGQLKSTLRCTVCGNTSVTFDPVWDLSVPLPSSSRCKLEACLDLFIREEVLDGEEMPTCSKCQTRRKSTKSFTIQRFPKYLVIHLKRFSETRWSKMSNIVEFPTGERELNMGPYGSNSSTNVYYSLYAISNHMGSTAGGHYVALCKHPITKKWHEFNDNVVSSELTESHLVSSSAYILFYERAHRRNEDHIINTDQAIHFLSQRKNQISKRKQYHEQDVVVAFPESIFCASSRKFNAIDSRIHQNDVVRLKSYNQHLQQREPIFLMNVLLGMIFYAILFTCYYLFF